MTDKKDDSRDYQDAQEPQYRAMLKFVGVLLLGFGVLAVIAYYAVLGFQDVKNYVSLEPQDSPVTQAEVVVKRVVDGDTLIIERPVYFARVVEIRGVGLPGPDLSAGDRAQAWAAPDPEAREALKGEAALDDSAGDLARDNLRPGTRVTLHFSASQAEAYAKDHGVLPADVVLGSGLLYSAIPVRDGAAYHQWNTLDDNGYSSEGASMYAERLELLEAEARDKRRGLWGDFEPEEDVR